MAQSLHEHFRGRQGEHFAARLFGDNIPYRGPIPPLRQEEVDELEVRAEAHVRTFRLWEAGDRADYAGLLQRHVGGVDRVLHRHHAWDAEKGDMAVYVEWVSLFRAAPPHLDLEHPARQP